MKGHFLREKNNSSFVYSIFSFTSRLLHRRSNEYFSSGQCSGERSVPVVRTIPFDSSTKCENDRLLQCNHASRSLRHRPATVEWSLERWQFARLKSMRGVWIHIRFETLSRAISMFRNENYYSTGTGKMCQHYLNKLDWIWFIIIL